MVKWLLQLGADPNAGGYRVTPLQIAVANCEVVDVRALLEANADPNSCGEADGIECGPDTGLGVKLTTLHGKSPLHVTERPEVLSVFYKKDLIGEMGEIMELLIKKGAKSFSVTNPVD